METDVIAEASQTMDGGGDGAGGGGEGVGGGGEGGRGEGAQPALTGLLDIRPVYGSLW